MLACSSLCFSVLAGDIKSKLKDHVVQAKESIVNRVIEHKESLVKRASAVLLLLQYNDSVEAQVKRLEFYNNTLQNNRLWQSWMHHPKRLYKWIITGKRIIKNIDTLVRDDEYVEDFLAYKALILGRALTEDEANAARVEAMQLLEEYKISRGMR